MTHCIKCGRPLRLASPDGFGPVCRRRVAPAVERDLFGYDIEKGAQAALHQVLARIEEMAVDAHAVIRRDFRAARVRMGAWAA